MDILIALLCLAASVAQGVTAPLFKQPLIRASKRVAAVGFFLGAVKYAYAAYSGINLAAVAITAIPLVLLSIASIINAWGAIFENQWLGEERRQK